MSSTELFRRCDSCRVLRRVDAEQTICGAYRPSRSVIERLGNGYTGPAHGRAWECDSTLTVDASRHAVVLHDPGHQSSSRCQSSATHEVHEAVIGHDVQLARWRDEEGSTHLLDVAPRDE